MAIDTQRKRQAIAAINLYAIGPSIVPDSSFDAGDRASIGYTYPLTFGVFFNLTAEQGAYTLSGQDVTLVDSGTAVWGDRLEYQSTTWSGGTGQVSMTTPVAGDYLVAVALVVSADAPIVTIASDQDGNFSLQQYDSGTYNICFGYLPVTTGGTHVITVTPTDSVSTYNATLAVENIEQAGETTIFDSTAGLVSTDSTATATSTTSNAITPTTDPSLVLFGYRAGPPNTVLDTTNWTESRGEVLDNEVAYDAVHHDNTSLAYTVTHDNSASHRTMAHIAFLQEAVGAFTLTAEQGSYTLSGQVVDLLVGHVITAEQGAYTLSGQVADLLFGHVNTAGQGSYALSGQDVTLTYTPLGADILTAEQGSYALSGQVADLLFGHVVTAEQGSYTLSGQDVILTFTPAGATIITAEQGSYTLSGQAAALLRTILFPAAQGAYTLTGQAVDLLPGRVVTNAQGSYTLTGQAVTFPYMRVILADQGSYALSGQVVNFVDSGLLIQPRHTFDGQRVTSFAAQRTTSFPGG